MDGGYITLHRKILEWRWFNVDYMLSFFVKLLFLANYEDKEWGNILIPRGSFVTSIGHLSELVGLTYKQTRIALLRLNDTGEVVTKGANKYTLITIVNYNTYQLEPGHKGRTKGEQRANKGQQLNKVNKVIKENTNVHFEEFWSCYDKKIGREKCYRWYMKHGSNGTHPLIMEGIKKWRESGRWDDKQYQHHPYTFLFNKMWEDDPGVKKVEGGVDEEFTRKFIRGEI